MRQLMAALRTTAVLVVLFAVAGLHNKHPSGPTPPHGGDGEGPKRPKFNPGMMPKRVGAAQQHGIKRAEEGRPKGADTSEPEAPKRTNPWDDPEFTEAMYDMRRFGQMGDGAMDKIWDGDGLGNGNHKPSSTEPGKTLFPPGTTKAQVEDWFKSIATNPDSRPQARPHGDGWRVTGTRDGITCIVILDKDGSISGGFPVSGEGVTTNPPA
ncbi:EndoU domain-containing protein [Micromonospora sp. NPDC050495]|uniref:EndoU domain-containing protein n=1 Tax=Micromonospora sp. NPDC050495 TaxID=3154936 RepID=UPI00340B2492